MISVFLIKKVVDSLSLYITQLSISVLPPRFNQMLVRLVQKSGNMMEAKNWRPVMIVNSTSKVVKMVLNNQIKSYLERNNLLSQQQHAYQAGKST